MDILKELFSLADPKYKAFHTALMPTVPQDKVIGVRTPALRALAKRVPAHEAEAFMQRIPHAYYEEDNLHGMLICLIKDPYAIVSALDAFLPHIDNWATCDLLSPPIFKKHKDTMLPHVMRWLNSSHTYTKRFGICCLMRHYLDNANIAGSLESVAAIRSDEYYINMAVAWFFATALAADFDTVLPYITEHRLDTWTHNKTISKARDSFRITPEQKELLKSFRR